LTAAGLITGAKWLLEAFYSTRLLKLRCGPAVRRNAWERALLARLQELDGDKPPSEPKALPQSTDPGPWQFELQCAELIRYHAKGLSDCASLEASSRDEARDIVAKLSGFRRSFSKQVDDVSDNVSSAPTTAIVLQDLQKVLLPEDAERAWAWLWDDGGDAGSGAWLWTQEGDQLEAERVEEEVLAQRVLTTRAETTELVSSIRQYNTIFALFRFVVQCCYGALLSMLSLAIFFPSAFERLCWAFSSLVVALSFIFGSLLREVCESLLLILIIRPFDVGDRVVVHGQRLLVVELHVLTTTFLNSCQEVVYLRNSLIFQDREGFVNLSHSDHAECMIQIEILAEDSTSQNVRQLELAMRRFCAGKPEVWIAEKCGTATINTGGCAGVTCSMSTGAGGGYVCWTFRAVHQRNLQDAYQARVDTSRLLSLLVGECVDQGIRLRRPPVEVRLVKSDDEAEDAK